MPDLLLELFSEEIPARMQAQAAADLQRLVTAALVERGVLYEESASFATPRRLALHVAGLPPRQPDTREERRGPRRGAPAAAIQGFVKSAGLASIEEAKIVTDAKKGAFYVAVIERPGRATIEILAELLPAIIKSFPWPKSMRWGAASLRTDSLRWIRPLHAIVATFGPETEETEIVDFAVDGIRAGNITYGHRFMAPGAIKVRRYDDYVAALKRAKVVLDPARRRDIIRHDARDLAFAQGLELVEDEALIGEVAGLVEWPVVLLGTFDKDFLQIPEEVIRATIRNNQKCFVLRDAAHAKLVNSFILVSNLEAEDAGQAIIAGNERVIRARLSDAKFFYETDLKTRLEDRLPKFRDIIFHEKLGTQAERIERIEELAAGLAPLVGADVTKAKRAARLCKADLLTEVVGEFPEVQGLMGKYYAEAQGEDEAVAHAIEDHYRPKGPDDLVPSDPVSIAVALADKLDTLVGFWAIGEKPTGSKDPYALRRAALGVIRIVLENGLRLSLRQLILSAPIRTNEAAVHDPQAQNAMSALTFNRADIERGERHGYYTRIGLKDEFWQQVCIYLLAFFADRLKVHLREKGARYDLIDAVFALPGQDDLLLIVRRVEALGRFLDTDDGRNLLVGYRRAANILRDEEKKDGAGAFAALAEDGLFRQPEESALRAALEIAAAASAQAIAAEDFEAAMQALSKLRAPVDIFFDKVTVNADEPRLRSNRLRLLNELRRAMHQVADFSKITG